MTTKVLTLEQHIRKIGQSCIFCEHKKDGLLRVGWLAGVGKVYFCLDDIEEYRNAKKWTANELL